MAGKSWQASIEPLCPLTAKGHRKKGRQGKVDWKKTVRFKHYGNQLLDWGMPHGCPILAGLQRGPLPRDIYSEKRGDTDGGIGRKLPGLNIQDTFNIIRQKNMLFSGHAFLLTVLGIVAQSICISQFCYIQNLVVITGFFVVCLVQSCSSVLSKFRYNLFAGVEVKHLSSM